METIYLVCAVIGGTLWVSLFVMSLFGGDADGADAADDVHGGDAHGEAPLLMGLVSVRGVIAALTFFGIGGLAGRYINAPAAQGLGMAFVAALAALAMTAAAARMLHHTTHDGTLRIGNAVGKVGTVYLRIPGNGGGRGKVTVKVQERLVEFQAITTGAELPTGVQVVVVNVVGPDTVEVIPAIV